MTNDRSRKTEIRNRMKATGEVYSVAARHVDLTTSNPSPKTAFLTSYGMKDVELLSPYSNLQNWVVPVYLLVTSRWEGDTKELEHLGQAYKQLDDEGHYFCYHHYTPELISDWLLNTAIEFDSTALQKNFIQNKEILNHGDPSIVEWFEKAFNNPSTTPYEILQKMNELLVEDKKTAKNTDQYTSDGILSLTILWGALSQTSRNGLVKKLVSLITEGLPPLVEANTDDIYYNRYYQEPPVPKIDLFSGDEVKFKGDGQPWTVQEASENFVVLTRISHSKRSLGQLQYTIIDWPNSRRGAHNSFGYGTETPEQIHTLIEDLELHISPTKDEASRFSEVELGRNQVSLRIQKVKPKK